MFFRDSDGSGGSSSVDMEMRIEQPYQPKVEVRIVPDDGCVILGKDEQNCTCDYATRYHIARRHQQCEDINHQVVHEELKPLCSSMYYSCKDSLWGFMRSEIFLLHLHVLVLALGVFKIIVHDDIHHRELHLVHAVLETTFACTILIIRAFIGKDMTQEAKDTRLSLEYVKIEGNSRSYSIKLGTIPQCIISFLLCFVIIGSFVLCYIYKNLGWTILSNNISIAISVCMSIVVRERFSRVTCRIKEDQHKIVILESALLLGEMYWLKQDDHHKDTRNKVERFLRGLKNTLNLQKPHYVECGEDLHINIVTNRESGL